MATSWESISKHKVGLFLGLLLLAVSVATAIMIWEPRLPGSPDWTTDNTSLCPCPVEEKVCSWVKTKYTPSEYEKLWYTHINEWELKVTEIVKAEDASISKDWVAYTKSQPVKTQGSPPSKIISKMEYFSDCPDVPPITRYVEPLAGLTRHPGYARGEAGIVDKSYLLMDCEGIKGPPGRKYWYFDLGASTWTAGFGGASQQWFHEVYTNCGIKFNGLYLWEAIVHPPDTVWNQVPFEVKPYYHWINIPAETAEQSPDNPLNFIRTIVKKEDFLVLKIDIDNTPVEEKFIEQLLASPDLLELVDDFFFEHHVYVPEMASPWGTKPTDKARLRDTYEIFRKFRNAGVVAHSWV